MENLVLVYDYGSGRSKDCQKMTSIELLKREAMVIMIPKIYGIVLDWAQVL